VRCLPPLFTAIICALTLLPLTSRAQDAAPVTPTTTPAGILPDNDLRSPRSTVATFLASMDPSDGKVEMERAVKTLDTSGIPELVLPERSEEAAVKLYAALSHVDFNSSKAPASATQDAIQLTDIAGHGIYLERQGPNWHFSKVTVADIPNIFREIEGNLSKKDMRELADVANPWLAIRTHIPERLKNTTLLVEDWQWIAGLLAIFALFLVHRLIILVFRWVIIVTLSPRLGLPPTINLQPLGRPVAVALLATALQLYLLTIDLPMDVYTRAVEWISTIRIVALGVLGIYLVEVFGERLSARASKTPSTVDDILYPLVQKALWVLVIVIALAQILTVHGVDVSGLVAGLGLGGLAFALAAKDTVENIFGSVAILLDQPFRVGDSVNIGGVVGTVEQIGLRSTRIRTPDNSLVSMPNSKVIAGHVDNLGARQFVRTKIVLNLAYDTTPQAIEALSAGIRELLRSHPKCKRDAIAVFLNEFNASYLGLLVQFHISARDWNSEQASKEQIFLAILTLVQELKIKLTAAPLEIKTSSPSSGPDELPETPNSEKAIEVARKIPVGWTRTNA
jgi:MscS family membrane protein